MNYLKDVVSFSLFWLHVLEIKQLFPKANIHYAPLKEIS